MEDIKIDQNQILAFVMMVVTFARVFRFKESLDKELFMLFREVRGGKRSLVAILNKIPAGIIIFDKEL